MFEMIFKFRFFYFVSVKIYTVMGMNLSHVGLTLFTLVMKWKCQIYLNKEFCILTITPALL